MAGKNYSYSSITVTTQNGEFTTKNCDYYIQDGFLVVFREKAFDEYDCGRTIHCCSLEKYYPLSVIVEISCVKG